MLNVELLNTMASGRFGGTSQSNGGKKYMAKFGDDHVAKMAGNHSAPTYVRTKMKMKT
jgi:hypothetical protein